MKTRSFLNRQSLKVSLFKGQKLYVKTCDDIVVDVVMTIVASQAIQSRKGKKKGDAHNKANEEINKNRSQQTVDLTVSCVHKEDK